MDLYLALLQVGFALPRHVAMRAVRSYPPHPCTNKPKFAGGLLSAALSVGSRPPGAWHSVLWSPDFPPARRKTGQRLSG